MLLCGLSLTAVFGNQGQTTFSNGTYASNSGQSYRYVVAPFWADIDTTYGGHVLYQTYTTGSYELRQVSCFVSNMMRVAFSGSWMLVAEWEDVPLDGQPNSTVWLTA